MKHFLTHIFVFLVTLIVGILAGQTYFQFTKAASPLLIAPPLTKTEPEMHLEVIEVRDSDVSRWDMNSGYLSMSDAVFFDDQKIMALWQDGIRVSHDGGKTWGLPFAETGELSKATGGVWGIDFLDAKIGWAFGNGLIKTDDGGQSWKDIELPEWIDNQQVKFLNENVGFIAGRGGYCERGSGRCNTWLSVYKTVNGGKTWRKSFKTKDFDTPWDILLVDENIAMITGGGDSLYRTTNGGRTWKKIIDGKNMSVLSVSRSPDGRFWLFGKNSIRLSDDLGLTWHAADNVDENLVDHEWWSVDFSNEGIGVAVSDDAAVMLTRDSGRSWKQVLTNLHVNGKIPIPNNPFNEQFQGVQLYGDKGIIRGSQRDYLFSIRRISE